MGGLGGGGGGGGGGRWEHFCSVSPAVLPMQLLKKFFMLHSELSGVNFFSLKLLIFFFPLTGRAMLKCINVSLKW